MIATSLATPALCIVIPTKNRADLLERCVRSIQEQEDFPWRAVIISDGSTDGTHALLERLSQDIRITTREHPVSRGVNVSRNEGLALLSEDEWGFLLDDDDYLLPGVLQTIGARLSEIPPSVACVFFNTRVQTPEGSYVGGYQHAVGEEYHDPTYLEVITKSGLKGDCKPAISAKLIARGYRFAEDVNGFESEFNALVARDGIGIRFYRDQVVHIDQAHGLERLSDTAAIRNPNAFVRVHLRMMKDHRELLRQHSVLRFVRAREGVRVALRAHDVSAVSRFVLELMSARLSVCCDALFSFFRNKEDIAGK